MNKKYLYLLITFFLSVNSTASISAEKYTSMYGFSLGDNIEKVKEKMGEPDKVVDSPSGSRGYAYFEKEHYVVFVTFSAENHQIASIQLTGEKASRKQGVDGVTLGTKVSKARKVFGDPDLTKDAVDGITGEPVPDTKFHDYGENLSIEEVKGKVSSIRISYDGTWSSDNPSDEKVAQNFSEEFIKVRDHILNSDYPERFEGIQYRISINDYLVFDYGNDGIKEVVLVYRPHFLQSPTVVFYQVFEDGTVKRVMEALAPGPLVKRGEYFIDSHSVNGGEGVDFTIGDINEFKREDGLKIAGVNKDGFGLIVQYKSFVHADNRVGPRTFVDMTDTELFDKTKQCVNFEFSKVDKIFAATTNDKTPKEVLIAVVGDKGYQYHIKRISKDGFIEKDLEVIDLTGLLKKKD